MTTFFGAWSLSGRPLSQLLPEPARRAMRALIPTTDLSAGLSCPVELDQPQGWPDLWLVTAADHQRTTAARAVGLEGILATGAPLARNLDELASPARSVGPDLALDGHYALMLAERMPRTLTLFRALSGGERLYYAELGELVLFAGALRYLSTHPKLRPRLNLERVPEALLTGLTLFGEGTLLAGIEEVLPGQQVSWAAGARRIERPSHRLLEPRRGHPDELAPRFHRRLGDAMAAAIGPSRPVAVTLSGGIDSAAMTALAVEAYGADNVVAFTYEFDDPSHPCETPFARAVCKRLGIRHHAVFQISMTDFLAAIPETVWRAESFVHWPKAFMLPVARHIREAGFDRFLSGFGVGSHMAYFDDLAAVARTKVATNLLLGAWRLGQHRRGQWVRWLATLHPGLAVPSWRLLLPYLCLLRGQGRIDAIESFYPPEVQPLVRKVPPLGSTASERALLEMPLAGALAHLSLERLFSCIDVTRWEKPMRELGALRLSPAHFASTLPYAYLPYSPQPFVWSAERALRPGKHLLRTALAGVLPHEVLYRRKSWADAVISPAWMRAGVRWMQRALDEDPLAALSDSARRAAADWDSRSPQFAVTAFRLWHRIFIESAPSAEPPTWRSLT